MSRPTTVSEFLAVAAVDEEDFVQFIFDACAEYGLAEGELRVALRLVAHRLELPPVPDEPHFKVVVLQAIMRACLHELVRLTEKA